MLRLLASLPIHEKMKPGKKPGMYRLSSFNECLAYGEMRSMKRGELRAKVGGKILMLSVENR
jgi:hypothetical protein